MLSDITSILENRIFFYELLCNKSDHEQFNIFSIFLHENFDKFEVLEIKIIFSALTKTET